VFADYGNVLIQAEKLQRQFEATVVVSIQELNGKTVYKLLAGAFPDKKSAEGLQKKLKAGGINGFIKDLKELA
jgi:hypothetical protein